MAAKPSEMKLDSVSEVAARAWHLTRVSSEREPSMVSARTLGPLIDAVVATGVLRATFLSAAKLDPGLLRAADARLPREKLFEAFECALDLTQNPAFALHSIERLESDALNPIAAMAVHAATLRDALASILEFHQLLGDQTAFRMHEEGEKVFVRCEGFGDQSPRVQRYMAELVLGGLYSLMRRFRAQAQVEYVAFAYAAPEYCAEYARVFEGRARFEQPFTELCFAQQLLAARSPLPDSDLHEALRSYAARRMRHLTDQRPYAARVRDLLIWQRPPRDMSMTGVARKLGVSVRSLRRYLSAEGQSFPKLMHEALAEIAKTCLRDERRTILETAFELGFSDSTSFHRAFKRWTGQTPREYRKP